MTIIWKDSIGVNFVEPEGKANSDKLLEMNDVSKNIILPTRNDVLNGRGKSILFRQGNIFYRNLIHYYKLEYIVASPDEQKLIAEHIMDIIRALSPSGRFLEKDKSSETWYDIGNKKAILKIRQALREGAPELRQQIAPNEIGSQSNDEMSVEECKQFLEMVSQR